MVRDQVPRMQPISTINVQRDVLLSNEYQMDGVEKKSRS